MITSRTFITVIVAAGALAFAAPASAAALPDPHPKLEQKLDGKVRGTYPAAPKFKLPADAERAPRATADDSADAPDAPVQRTQSPDSKQLKIGGWEGTVNQKLSSVLYYVRNYYGRIIRNFRQPTVYRDAASYTFTCGGQPASVKDNAIFCPNPYYIAFDTNWFSYFNNQNWGGDMAWAIILSHEFGHATANNLGLSASNTPKLRWTIYNELFADCIAGSWAADLQRQGRLDNIAPGDYREAVNAMFSVGDPAGTPWYQEGAHGSGALRRSYMDYGWRNGAQACVNWVRS